MTKLIVDKSYKANLLRLPENEECILPKRAPQPRLSPEELKKLRRIRGFQLESEAAIVNYFARKLNEAEQQYSGPIDLKQFYIDQVIQSLPQLKSHGNLLTAIISTGRIH